MLILKEYESKILLPKEGVEYNPPPSYLFCHKKIKTKKGKEKETLIESPSRNQVVPNHVKFNRSLIVKHIYG